MNWVTVTQEAFKHMLDIYGSSSHRLILLKEMAFTYFCIQMSYTNAAINSMPSPPLPGDSKDLPGDLILYFMMMSTIQPDCRGFFSCKSSGRASPHFLGHLGQRYTLPGNLILYFVTFKVQPRVGPGCAGPPDTIFCKSPGKSPLQPRLLPGQWGPGIQLITTITLNN